MDDCGIGDSAASTDCWSAPDTSTHCWSAPDTSTHCSSSVEPPPDYSTCISHPETGSSNHHSGTADTTHHSHHGHPNSGDDASTAATSHILHDVASSGPFFDVTPGLENGGDGLTTSRPNVHGRKTVVLKRTDAQNRARRTKLIIGMCLGLMIGALIPIVVLIFKTR